MPLRVRLGGSRLRPQLNFMLTQPISVLARMMQESMLKTQALIQLREQRRADPAYRGCPFCFDVGCGQIGEDTWVPCPEHNGLCL